MSLTNGFFGSIMPTIGPNGYTGPTGAYQSGNTLIPIGSYHPAATTDWNNPMAGLGQDALTALQNGQPYVLPGGNYDPMGKSYGVITAGNMPSTGSDSPMKGYSYIPMNGQQKNANDYWFNPDGSYNSAYQNTPIMGYAKGIGTVVGAALGMGAIGAAAGGATTAAGATGESIGAANAVSDAAAYNSLSPAAWESAGLGSTVAPSTGALGSVGATTELGAGSGVFNPAVDSQLANAQLGITGNQAALSAAEGAIPSVTVNGVPNGGNFFSNLFPGGAGSGGGTLGSLGNIMNGSGSATDWLSLGSTALGALAGSKGVQQNATSTKSMDPRMDNLFYNGLAPATMSTLGTSLPAAQLAGGQMLSVGSGLLGQTAPSTATNPYLSGMADDMQRRTQQLLGQNNLAIQGNSVATGGLGGSRQGVAQGLAAGQAADTLQGNLAGLYGNAYNQDQTRLLQQQTLGAGLMTQGLNTQFAPLQSTANVFNPFTGFGTTSATQSQGGGAVGALGGALGAAQVGKAAGWW